MNERLKSLLQDLRDLHSHLRDHSYKEYKRINPFYEDLFEFKERGEFWTSHKNVTIYNSATVSGDVEIGEKTWIGPFCSLDGSGGLKIGSNCSISLGVQILTHDSVKWALSGGKDAYERAPTMIGNNCFIGTYAVITKGVTLDDRCLVGAHAFVNKSFAKNTIIAGVPAKKIGTVIEHADGRIELKYD